MSKDLEKQNKQQQKLLKLFQKWANENPKFKPPYTELEMDICKAMKKLGLDIN